MVCRGGVVWSTQTAGQDIDVFQFQQDGNLVVRKNGGDDAWESSTVHDHGGFAPWDPRPTLLVMQDDGNLVLYAGSDVRWSTNTKDKCLTGKFTPSN